MPKRTELLVHAGAPSSHKGDEQSRAQARAYLAFRPQRAIQLSSKSWQSNESDNASPIAESPAVFLDDTQLAISGLQSQLLTSSLPIASERVLARDDGPSSPTRLVPSSPPIRHHKPGTGVLSQRDLLDQIRSFGKRKREDERNAQFDAPRGNNDESGGVVDATDQSAREHTTASTDPSLSSYLKTPILDRTVKKARLTGDHGTCAKIVRSKLPMSELDHVEDAVEHPTASPNHSIHQQAPAATAPAAMLRSQESVNISEPTSELPTSYSLSDITSESSRVRCGISQRPASAPAAPDKAAASSSGHVDSSTVTDSNGTRDGRAKLPSPRAAQFNEIAEQPEVVVIADNSLPESNMQAKPAQQPHATHENSQMSRPDRQAVQDLSTSRPRTASHAQALQTIQMLGASVHPPEPEVSIAPFTTHITPALASLASNPDMAGRYQPASVRRELRKLERGCWTFDASALPVDRQVKLWQFLEQAIRNGGPGWGIWCERDGGPEGLGSIRVWCWGEVVKHVYLLLYVASSSQVRKLGARWIDAEDEEVVKMKSPEAVADGKR